MRFLGSTEVQKSKGEGGGGGGGAAAAELSNRRILHRRLTLGIAVVYDTMRRVLHARAVHGVFKMVESKMVISTTGVKLIDPSAHDVRTNVSQKQILLDKWTSFL